MRTSVADREARAIRVHMEQNGFVVHLDDGRTVFTPWDRHWRLADASVAARRRVEIGCHGTTLRWPDVDEDLLVADLGRTDTTAAPRP